MSGRRKIIGRRELITAIGAVAAVFLVFGVRYLRLRSSSKNADDRQALVSLFLYELNATCPVATRWYAARSLGDLEPEAQQAVPALLEALKDNDTEVRE